MMGALVAVGNGRLTIAQLRELVQPLPQQQQQQAPATHTAETVAVTRSSSAKSSKGGVIDNGLPFAAAPAHGLYLHHVRYDDAFSTCEVRAQCKCKR